MENRIIIGITDCSKYQNYHNWIASEGRVGVVKLSAGNKNLDEIAKCDGVVLTGGEDVHPRFYDRMDYLPLCHEIDERRDEFEWSVLEQTEKRGLPLLGICRGLQIANVFFGGTLLPHIPAFGKFDHAKIGSHDRHHQVNVDPASILARIVASSSGEINSAHHQGADRIGHGLVATALSPDNVVEGLEKEDKDAVFFQLVQWHPERMIDGESPFSKNLKKSFLEACHSRK